MKRLPGLFFFFFFLLLPVTGQTFYGDIS